MNNAKLQLAVVSLLPPIYFGTHLDRLIVLNDNPIFVNESVS